MKPTEILKNEHRVIEKMLSVLENFYKRAEGGEEINTEHAEKIIEFFRIFADKCHHGKEEDMLFPEMEKAGVPREGGPIGVMLFEHTQGRNFIKGMAEAIEEIKKGTDSKLKFIENAKGYINLLREHIYKEDNILFNMADMHLTHEVQNELIERFEKFEKEEIGEGVHERFHKLAHDMEEVYK